MSEPFISLVENLVRIAWDYLDRTGEADDEDSTVKFLLRSVRRSLENGERES